MPHRISARSGATVDDHKFDPRHPMHHGRRERWAKANDYTLSRKHPVCLYALAGQKHSPCFCQTGIVDHAESWTRNGEFACITCQPYSNGLAPSEIDRLQAKCQQLGLHISVFQQGNWYNQPGGVLLVVIERAQFLESEAAR